MHTSLSHDHGGMNEVLFGSISQFRLERCVTYTSFVVSVNITETVRQLFCVMSNKVSETLLLSSYSRDLAESRGQMLRELKWQRLASDQRGIEKN